MDSSMKQQEMQKLLPGFNCGACGEKRCDAFADRLIAGQGHVDQCPHMAQVRFADNKAQLIAITGQTPTREEARVCTGLIDGYQADFELLPLPDEPSCREVLFPFSRKELKAGDIIRYRPLGCPMTHFAEIIKADNGLITVYLIGPRNRMNDPDFHYEDVGVCMVGGFEGVIDGPLPFVGQTVRFLPHHCMMRKVHSGVVVQLVGERVIIEGIDLKVWAPPI